MVPKEKKIFHYDIFEDNAIDGQRLFGVKLSIDEKDCKARATSKKKAEEKASQRAYFAFQENG
jgi:ribonuclease-3